MSIEERRWSAFLSAAGIPYQYKPLTFAEEDDENGFGGLRHTPSFLLSYERHPIWLEVLPRLSTGVLEDLARLLHFARSILSVEESSDYWPIALDCIFVAFGNPGTPASPYLGTYAVMVTGTDDNPRPGVFGALANGISGYGWAECLHCGRVTLCMQYTDTAYGDWTGSTRMSCCGHVFPPDTENSAVRESARLRRAMRLATHVRPQ